MKWRSTLECGCSGRAFAHGLREAFLQLGQVVKEDVFLAREVGEDRLRRDLCSIGDFRDRRLLVALPLSSSRP
jgi:hypothetical protein